MKTSIIASIIGAAVMVAAQTPDLSQLPSCALPCATSSMTSASGCSSSDFPCICKDEKFISTVSTCLQGACKDPQDIAKAVTFAQALCGSNLPSGAVTSLQGAPTGNATTGGYGGNATKTQGPGSSSTGKGANASSTATSGSVGGLVPGGFAVAAIFAGLLTL